MSALLANRAVRRKGAAYVVLLVLSLVFLGDLVEPVRPGHPARRRLRVQADPGRDRRRRRQRRSIARPSPRSTSCARRTRRSSRENEPLEAEARSAQELRRENELLTGLLQLRNGLEYETRPVAVIARESSEARRAIVIDRGADDGIKVGQIVDHLRRRAGRAASSRSARTSPMSSS